MDKDSSAGCHDLEIGRYISSDPIGIKGGLNTFGYATQNPVMWIDPLGWANINGTQGTGWIGDVGDLYNPAGYYSVYGHSGLVNGILKIYTGVYGALDADQLATVIQNDPNYHTGEPVVLVSCNTGGDYAEELSKQLGGAEVIAPTGYVWPSPPQWVNGQWQVPPFTVHEVHWYNDDLPGEFISYPSNQSAALPY